MLQLILLAAVPAAQRDYIAMLYEEYRIPMWKYAHAITGSPEAADDVVQAAFVALLGKAELLENLHPRQRDSYIAVTVRHLAAKHCQNQTHLDIDDMGIPGNGEQQYRQILDREQIRHALRRLPDSDKDIILLRYGLDQTHEQIAAQLDIQPGTVRVRLHRVLQRLRRQLGEETP